MKKLLILWGSITVFVLILIALTIWYIFVHAPTTELGYEKYRWKDTKYARIRTKIAISDTDQISSTVEYPTTEKKSVNDIIGKKIDEFRTTFNTEVRFRKPPRGQKFEQNISYQVIRQNKEYLSLATTAFRNNTSDFPERETAYWTFDMRSGRVVTLRDLFADKATDGIARVTLYIKQAIAAKQKAANLPVDMSIADAVLTPQYVSNFLTPDRSSLRFDFWPGEVADPELGSLSVTLTVDNLQLFMQNEQARSLFGIVPISQATHYEPKKVEGATAPNCVRVKCIALTFDDGPSKYTDELLDTLRDKRAHASFFLIGKNVAQRPDIVKRQKAEGHTIGNHTWSHPWLTRLSANEIEIQLTQTNDAISAQTNEKPTYVRPPNGAVNQTVYASLEKLNMTAVLWSVDTRDWADRNSQIVANRVIAGVKPGAIIILHDVHKTSVQAVPKIIDTLQKNGYVFVSLDEMLGPNAAPGKIIMNAQ